MTVRVLDDVAVHNLVVCQQYGLLNLLPQSTPVLEHFPSQPDLCSEAELQAERNKHRYGAMFAVGAAFDLIGIVGVRHAQQHIITPVLFAHQTDQRILFTCTAGRSQSSIWRCSSTGPSSNGLFLQPITQSLRQNRTAETSHSFWTVGQEGPSDSETTYGVLSDSRHDAPDFQQKT